MYKDNFTGKISKLKNSAKTSIFRRASPLKCDLRSSQDACGMLVIVNRDVKAIAGGVVLVRGYLGVKRLWGC